MICPVVPLSAATGQQIANTVPRYVPTAINLGPTDPTTTIDVSIWLNLHNRSALDTLAAQLYNPSSPNYRHWLTPSELLAQFGPSTQDIAAVEQFLQSHNLSVVAVGPGNLFVRARGTLGNVEKAFQVQINNYETRSGTYFAPASDPYVDGPAGGLVRAVAGLDNGGFSHPLMTRPTSFPGIAASAVQPNTSLGFTSNCFGGPTTEQYTTEGSFPSGTYRGNLYFGSATNPSPGCGYTPTNIAAAYNLTGLYNEGYTGQGQTITIIDWCGSPTVEKDANTFSKQFGLPMLNSSNFTITEVPIPSQCSGPDVEINLDVEWAHAVAPGASINLVVPPSSSFQDTDEAESYIVIYELGSVISGSYGAAESEVAVSELENENLIAEMAATEGISANFSSGDYGDFSAVGLPPTVSSPASEAYTTSVGGISVALNSDNSIAWQTGWGNNEILLAEPGFIFDPPFNTGLYGGSGGGPSGVFAKPAFQNSLPGNARLVPDISWVADPFTGVVVVETEAGDDPPQVWFAIGGTSVSCPMFSALWVIANQEAGLWLGQAASYVYSMPSGAITDILPVGSVNNVIASIHESSTVDDRYDAKEVMGDATEGAFYSAIWNYPYEGGILLALSFGTDCYASATGFGTLCTSPGALLTAPGWDNVTGVGVPNAQAFADSFKP